MRRSFVIGAVLIVLAFVLVGGPSILLSLSTDQTSADRSTQASSKPTPELVTLEDSESSFWEYLSPRKEFKRQSPINVIVRGDTEDVERILTEADGGNWSEINESEEEALPDTFSITNDNASENETDPPAESDGESFANNSSENRTDENGTPENATNESASEGPQGTLPNLNWGSAEGGTRYAYVDPGPDEDGYWMTETRQLQDGDYYGQRYHIRLYESPNEDDDWVIMQTHSEHFDWFTLRHRVHGSQDAQTKVESEFMAHPAVDVQEDMRRMYLDNRNAADADGWATLVELAGLFVVPTLVGVGARRRRASSGTEQSTGEQLAQRAPNAIDDHLTEVDRQRLAAAYARLEAGHILLVFTILALYLGVRMGGLVLERRAGFLTPHQIAALLYPVIGVGIPVATYMIARGLTRRLDAAVVAAGSLAVAVWLDYSLLGVSALPVDVVLQRMLVVVALGLIAGGAAKRAARGSKFNDMLAVGSLMWVLVLIGTLLGYL